MKIVEVYVTGKAWLDGNPYLSYAATCEHNPTTLTARANEQVMWDCGCPYDPTGSQKAIMDQTLHGQMVQLSGVVTELKDTTANVLIAGMHRAVRPIQRMRAR